MEIAGETELSYQYLVESYRKGHQDKNNPITASRYLVALFIFYIHC